MASGQDLPSWARKNTKKAAVQAADPSLPSWAVKKNPGGSAGAVVVASTPEHKTGILGRFVNDAKDLATHAVGGVQDAGTTVGKTFYYDVRYGPTSEKATRQRKKLADLETAIATSTAQDLRHPLRHPGYTALDLLGIASGGAGLAARGAAAGKAVKAAEGASRAEKAGKAAKALATRPSQGSRTFTHAGVTATKSGSRNALIRASQRKVLDPLRHAFPDVPVIGSAATVGRLTEKELRRDKRLSDAEAGAFFKHARAAGMLKRNKAGKVSQEALVRQHAMRVVAEGVPVEQRLATHNDYLNRGYNASAKTDPEIAAMRSENFTKGHNEQVALNEAVSKYVRTVKGHDGKLHVQFTKAAHDAGITDAYFAAKKLAGSRENLLERINKLDAETKQGRYAAPGREFFGQGEGFAGGEMRIPTVPKGKTTRSRGDLPQIGAQGVVNGVPKAIASIYKPYLGKAYKAGRIRNDVVRLMHESWQEAQRYFTLVNVTDKLRSASHDFRASKHDVLIKMEDIPGQPNQKEARAIAEDADGNAAGLADLAYRYESVRQQMFPGDAEHFKRTPIGETAPPGYKWVDGRLLGGLNRRNPLLGALDYKVVKGAVKVTDAINNASKLGILYLKPAYVVSNTAGNSFLLLTQQGFAAPANLKRAALLNAETDPATVAKIDAAIGEGVSSVLDVDKTDRVARVTHAAAKVASNVVDLIPRRAAFLHEASKEGFNGKNLAELFEPENSEKLHLVMQRMDAAMIDYGDLNAFERGIVRRVIFFYPWVKGATKWTVRYAPEHPIQAAVGTQFAEYGKQRQQDELGSMLPSWAQGLVPAGAGRTTNPSSIGILSTPVDLANSIIQGKASDNLPPGVGIVTGYRHPFRAAKDQAQSLPVNAPLDLLLQQAGIDAHLARDSKTFPDERKAKEAILLWLLGSGVAPRKTDVDSLARSAFYGRQHKP